MSQLLEAVSLEKDGLDRSLEASQPGTAEVNHHQAMQKHKVNRFHVFLILASLWSFKVLLCNLK